MKPRLFRLAATTVAVTAVAIGLAAAPAQAAPGATPDAGPAATPTASPVATITDALARRLATDAGRTALFAAATGRDVTLSRLAASPALDGTLREANRAVRVAKGLPTDGADVLRLRLAHPDMRAALAKGVAPLVASVPSDDDTASVTAYDASGRTVFLDAARLPQRPVFVVDVDVSAALEMGLRVFRSTLDSHGITAATPSRATVQSGYWATQVRSVRLSNDHEPWVKGAAEIFGIAGGFGLDSKVKVDTVTMPYLDHDGTTYYPNQLIVHFSAYKYNLADYVMMEDDGDTNYQSLARAIATALLTIVDGGAYIPLVTAIIDAIPASWWSDDPDYVDSWYTMTTSSGGRFTGAAANGWMDLAPYWVAPL
ncbi:MAG TPA: DUF3103 family protein [Pseudonocardiaceae bacterium]